MKVVRRERNTDLDVALGVNYNTRVRNEEAPAPPFTGITAGLSIPLKFSNINKGALHAEQMRVQQAEHNYEQARLTVRVEVMQKYKNYMIMRSQAADYEELLSKSKTVIDSKTNAYGHGNCSLLEVLDAQRTYDDVRRNYIETLYNEAVALVELQQSAGIWSIEINER